MSDFAVDPRPIAPELADDYEAATWPEIIPSDAGRNWVPLEDKLDHATRDQLKALMHGGIGEPTVSVVDLVDGDLA